MKGRANNLGRGTGGRVSGAAAWVGTAPRLPGPQPAARSGAKWRDPLLSKPRGQSQDFSPCEVESLRWVLASPV